MLSDRCLSVCSVLSVLFVLSVTLVCCGQTVRWIKMKLGMQVGLCPGHTVLDGDQFSPSPKAAQRAQFSAHVYCDQMAGLIKMPLGTKVRLVPGNVVLNGDPVPTKTSTAPPNFRPCLLWPNGWMDEDAT